MTDAVWRSLLAAVLVLTLLGVVWLNAYAALLHGARGTLTRPRVRRAVERITRAVL